MNKFNYIKDDDDKKYFMKRLSVIEGQIRGLSGMINDERSYEEVLIQLGAFTNSLRNLGRDILQNYITNNLEAKNKSEIDEIVNLFNKLV